MNMRRIISILVLSFALVLPPARGAGYTATVSPATVLVTNYEGWGTSLCWWANVVGGYTNAQEYCDLAFYDLELNIVRYNIGGGENPSLTNTITNYRAIMQGFEPTNGIWNWNADTNQRYVLRQAIAQGANLVDAFANSPPWWMTVSGSVTGNTSSTASLNDNLQTAYEVPFAIYLATVVSNLTVLDGVHFNYCTPMNEPVGTDWKYANGKQEGCNIDPGQQARLVNDLRVQMNALAPSVGIDAAEDYSESQTLTDLESYTNGAFPNVALISTHTYSANDAGPLESVALSSGKRLWVAEYGDGDGSGLTMAQHIHDDISGMGASAWIYWQVVDNAGGWGFLYNPLAAPTSSSYSTAISFNEKFFVMGQYSDFISPGCNIISVNDPYTLAAFNPTNSTLTLVMVNTNTSGFNVTYNLGAFTSLPTQVSVYQTAGALGEYWDNLPSLAMANGEFTAAIPAQSVTSFVLTNVTQMPVLLSQGANAAPTNYLNLYSGAHAALSVSAVGSQPLYYQWFSNNVALAGATNASYTAPNAAQGTNSYQCIVTNFAGSATGSVWSVSVAQPPIASYPLAVLALNPLGYWRLNETPNNDNGNQGVVSHDYASGNNGVYSNVFLATEGYSPVADPAGTAATFGSFLSTNSDVTQIGEVNFSAPPGGNAEFTVTAWVKGGAQTSDAGIVTKGYGNGGEQFNLDTGSDSVATHGFRFFVRDAFGNTHGCNSTYMPDGNWHFLAAVCDESNGAVHLFIDGVDRADGTIWPGTALQFASAGSLPTASLVSIGSRTAGKTSTSFTNQFAGTIDEVAIFNYALSANQIQALYAAAPVPAIQMATSDSGMKITYTGTLQSSTNVAGPFAPVPGATSPYSVTMAAPQMFYRVSNP